MHTRFWWKNLTLWNVGSRWEDNLKNGVKKGMLGSGQGSCSWQGHVMACYEHTNKPWSVIKRREVQIPEELSVSQERLCSMGQLLY
jgi:hypothetical protein